VRARQRPEGRCRRQGASENREIACLQAPTLRDCLLLTGKGKDVRDVVARRHF